VMNDTWVGSTVPDGHTDRSDWQVSHRALTHGPADDTPRESVNVKAGTKCPKTVGAKFPKNAGLKNPQPQLSSCIGAGGGK